MAGPEIGFLFQFGTTREIVTTNAATLTLNKLKDLACDFINTKVSVSLWWASSSNYDSTRTSISSVGWLIFAREKANFTDPFYLTKGFHKIKRIFSPRNHFQMIEKSKATLLTTLTSQHLSLLSQNFTCCFVKRNCSRFVRKLCNRKQKFVLFLLLYEPVKSTQLLCGMRKFSSVFLFHHMILVIFLLFWGFLFAPKTASNYFSCGPHSPGWFISIFTRPYVWYSRTPPFKCQSRKIK